MVICFPSPSLLSSHFGSFHLCQVHTLGPHAAHLPPLALHPVTSQAPPTLSRPGRPRPPGLPPDPHPGPLGPCLTPLLMALQGPCPPCPNACPQKVPEIPDWAAILLWHHCSGSRFAIRMAELWLSLTAVGLFLVFNKTTHFFSCSIFYCYPSFYAWLKWIWDMFHPLIFCGVRIGIVFWPWGHH